MNHFHLLRHGIFFVFLLMHYALSEKFELHLDLTNTYGTEGYHGICMKTFRVTVQPSIPIMDYCKNYYNSRIAKLEDLADFYNLVLNSRSLNDTLRLVMGDVFNKQYNFRIELVRTSNQELWIMSEMSTTATSDHVMCVEEKQCEPITTPTPPTTTTVLTTSAPVTTIGEKSTSQNTISGTNNIDRIRKNYKDVIDDILDGSTPRNWVITTLILGVVCLSLLCLIIILMVSICRMKMRYKRKKCYGVCRYGCRCNSSDAGLRGPLMDAQVCGSMIQSQTGHLTPHLGSEAFRSGYQPLCSMKSTPLFVSMADPTYTTHTISPSNDFATLGRPAITNWTRVQAARPRRLSQETNGGILRRSTSDGSSVNDNQSHAVTPVKTDFLANGFAGNKSNYACYATNGTVLQLAPTNQVVSFSGIDNSRYLESLDRRQLALSSATPRFFPSNINEEMSPIQDEPIGIIRTSTSTHQMIRSLTNGVENKDYQLESEIGADLVNIRPPAEFFDLNNPLENTHLDYSQSGHNLNRMIGNTGTFRSTPISQQNSSPVDAGDSGLTIQSGGIWSGSSSPKPGHNGETPALPPRGGRQCSSIDSNDSGKSSNGLRPSPLPKPGFGNGHLVMPKLTDLYSGVSLGPPIVIPSCQNGAYS